MQEKSILSPFLSIPAPDTRYRPTFDLALALVALLAGVYWYTTRSLALLLVPLAISRLQKPRTLSAALFCAVALYCAFREYTHKVVQNGFTRNGLSGVAHIAHIAHNEVKNNYLITCAIKSKTVQIVTRERPELQAGDKVLVRHAKCWPIKHVGYQRYLLKEQICGRAYTSHLNGLCIAHEKNSWHLLNEKTIYLDEHISKKLSPTTGTLFSSLFLGSKKYLSASNKQLKEHFNNWGINHFLARSGLHVSLILFIVALFTRFLPGRLIYRNVITCIFLIGYLLFSYSSVSFMRALIGAFLGLWCLTQQTPSNTLHILLIALAITVLYNPFFALFLDFQLTFLLTFGLCVISLLDF